MWDASTIGLAVLLVAGCLGNARMMLYSWSSHAAFDNIPRGVAEDIENVLVKGSILFIVITTSPIAPSGAFIYGYLGLSAGLLLLAVGTLAFYHGREEVASSLLSFLRGREPTLPFYGPGHPSPLPAQGAPTLSSSRDYSAGGGSGHIMLDMNMV